MKMIEVKTAELVGPALDWAVAEAEGITRREPMHIRESEPRCWSCDYSYGYSPSTDWSQCGPLIEKYHIQTSYNGNGFPRSPTSEYWCAYACDDSGAFRSSGGGPTPLIAICLAIVRANLGDVVQVPEELVASA